MKNESTVKTLYRINAHFTELDFKLEYEELPVIKETPCGYWVASDFGYKKRFVLKQSQKRFACVTKDLALESFKAKKRRQISLLKEQLRLAEGFLEVANSGKLSTPHGMRIHFI